MISKELIEENAQNRRLDKATGSFSRLSQKIELSDYENIIEWMLEFCATLDLTRPTKFLARRYFDGILMSSPQRDSLQNHRLAIASMSIAINFMECRRISQHLSPKNLYNSALIDLTPLEIFGYQQEVLLALSYQLQFTTPIDYFPILDYFLPCFKKNRNALDFVIDFAILLPQCISYRSEEIFYASVVAALEYNQVRLNDNQLTILRSLSDSWNNIQVLGKRILEELNVNEDDLVLQN